MRSFAMVSHRFFIWTVDQSLMESTSVGEKVAKAMEGTGVASSSEPVHLM
jgi:hypothetical protein